MRRYCGGTPSLEGASSKLAQAIRAQCIVIGFLLSGCSAEFLQSQRAESVQRSTNARLTEKMYADAARHCHSKTVIRMKRGIMNTFYVGGLSDARGKVSGEKEAKRIECVRQYLGVPRENVIVVFS